MGGATTAPAAPIPELKTISPRWMGIGYECLLGSSANFPLMPSVPGTDV